MNERGVEKSKKAVWSVRKMLCEIKIRKHSK